MKIVSKSSFTLFELLIVILIISILYGIFVQKIASKEHLVARGDNLLHLNDLLQGYDFNESAQIVCVDKCKSCYIEIDGKRQKELELFDSEVEVYDFDIHGLLSPLKFVPVFEDGNPKDVCFRYTLYPNGSNSSYIVHYKEKFYIFYAYMRPVQVTKSITEAQKAFDPSQWIPTDSSDYNF